MLVVYNTLSRSKEEFKPIHGKEVRMFVCGQTVYDDAHLGHAKNYINFDIMARWLRRSGYQLKYIQNITDIDDKIIKRAEEEHTDPLKLARKYEARLMEDMEALGIRKNIDGYPRSHDFIEAIREQIQLLIDNGYAYILGSDIYYDVAKFHDYTKLSGMKIEELEKHRIEPKEGKKNPYDFALWKGSKPGEPSWSIKLNYKGGEISMDGRPGWHIEDTAITHEIFGKQYDIHGGAIELIFPHHTNEIAQAEAAFKVKPFVRYWIHSGIMLIKGEKMSKSTKNFIRIRDLLKTYSPESLRLLVASTQYRKDIPYTEQLMKNAALRLRYIYASLSIFYNSEVSDKADPKEVNETMQKFENEFKDAMDDDFNTPLALSTMVNAIDRLRTIAESSPSVNKTAKEHAIEMVTSYANVMGIMEKADYKEKLPENASTLIKERESLRKAKKYAEADAIRESLRKEFGIIVEDSEYGPVWYRKAT